MWKIYDANRLKNDLLCRSCFIGHFSANCRWFLRLILRFASPSTSLLYYEYSFSLHIPLPQLIAVWLNVKYCPWLQCVATIFIDVEEETQLYGKQHSTAQRSRLQQFSSLPILYPAAAVGLSCKDSARAG